MVISYCMQLLAPGSSGAQMSQIEEAVRSAQHQGLKMRSAQNQPGVVRWSHEEGASQDHAGLQSAALLRIRTKSRS